MIFREYYKIRITIRPYVWSTICRQYSTLSGIRQYIKDLRWTPNELKKVLAKRIESYVCRNDLNIKCPSSLTLEEKDDWFLELIFADDFDLGSGNRPAYKIISKWASNRPRWMIELCKVASDDAYLTNSPQISYNHFVNNMQEFGKRRVDDLSSEFISECTQIAAIINKFTHSPSLFTELHNLQSFVKKEIMSDNEIFIQGVLGKVTDIDILRLLYKIDFLQAREDIITGKGHNTKKSYKHYYFSDRPELLDKSTASGEMFSWEIQPLFKQYLCLNEKGSDSYTEKRRNI
jgi:hypothetical protein